MPVIGNSRAGCQVFVRRRHGICPSARFDSRWESTTPWRRNRWSGSTTGKFDGYTESWVKGEFSMCTLDCWLISIDDRLAG